MESEKINLIENIDKKIWIKPDLEIISVESGNKPLGQEGHRTGLYNGITFTGFYFS